TNGHSEVERGGGRFPRLAAVPAKQQGGTIVAAVMRPMLTLRNRRPFDATLVAIAAIVALAAAILVLRGGAFVVPTMEPIAPNVTPAATQPAAPANTFPLPNIDPTTAPQPTSAPQFSAAPQSTIAPSAVPVATPRLTTPPLASPRATIAPPQPTANGGSVPQQPTANSGSFPQGSGMDGANGPADADQGGGLTTEGTGAPVPEKVILPKGSMGQ